MSTSPVIGVLALQGAFREHVNTLDRLGAATVAVRAPEDLAGLDGIVLPGGESTTMDKLLRRFGLQQPLRRDIESGLPVLATCAGLILLADDVRDGLPDQESLGCLRVAVRRNAYGRQPESFETGLDFEGLDGPFRGVFIRAPVIDEVRPGVEVLAAVEGHPVAIRQGDIIGLTFHPELSDDDRVHRQFLDVVEAAGQGRADGDATAQAGAR